MKDYDLIKRLQNDIRMYIVNKEFTKVEHELGYKLSYEGYENWLYINLDVDVKLTIEDWEEYKKDRFHKHDINSKIKNILPIEDIDNFYKSPERDKNEEDGWIKMNMKVDVESYPIQYMIIKHMPEIITDYESQYGFSDHIKKEYEYLFDASDLGLL